MENNRKSFFCTNCGKPLAEGARFCEECGAPVEPVRGAQPDSAATGPETVSNDAVNNADSGVTENLNASAAKETGSAAEPETVANEAADSAGSVKKQVNFTKPAMPSDKNLKKIILAAVAVAVVVIVAVLAAKNHKKTINLEDYVTYEFYGYDTEGTASIHISSEALEEAVLPTMEKKLEKNAEKYATEIRNYYYYGDEDFPDGMTYEEFELLDTYYWDDEVYASDLVTVSSDKTSGLTNGDEITVTFDYDNELLGKYGLKFKGDTMTVTVADLPEAETVDVFADVNVTFSGASPFLSTDSCYEVEVGDYYVDVNVEPYENLAIGDEITLTVDTDDFPDGYVPKEMTKTITVENADQYIQNLDDVTDDLWSLLKTQAEDELTADVAGNWSDDVTFNGMEYQGAYLLVPKTLDDWDYSTELYLVYKVNATTPAESVTYYWWIKWENPMLYEDGTAGISSITSGEFPESYEWFAPDYYVESDGYTFGGSASIDIFYSEIITPQVGDYSVETDIQ